MRRAGQWLLILALTWAVLLDGAVELWALFPAVLLLAMAAVLVTWEAEPKQPRRGASVLFWCAAVLTVYTALQALPLPASLVRALSPHAADIWGRALHSLGRSGPAWHPLSLDPQATRVEVLRGTTYLALFFAALSMSRVQGERRLLERMLVALAVVVAVATVAHIGLDARRLWGFYLPRTGVGMIAPFFNKNQLAGFLNIGLLVAAGSTFSADPVMPRSVSAAAVVGLAAMVVFLGSRGAVGAAIVGLVVVGGLSWRSGRIGRKRGEIALPLLVACAGVALAIFASHDRSAHSLESEDVSKLLVTKACLTQMAPRYPLFGVGRGSFESTFPEFRHDSGWFVFTHPENVFAQWTTEWGIPVAALAFLACAIALRPRAAMARSRPAVGPLAALIALFLQNLVDFSSEFPGVVMALCVCAALVVGGSGGRAASKTPWFAAWSMKPRRTGQILAAAVLAGAALASVGFGHDVLSDRAEVLARGAQGRDDDPDVVKAILAHPAEPYFPYIAAARAARENNARVIAWVDRALERAPVYGPAHLVLARWLRGRSPAQSRLEYRIAQEQGGADVPIAEIAGLVRDYYDAIEVAPQGEAGVAVLDGLSKVIAKRYPASSARIDEEILRRHPGYAEVLARTATQAWVDVNDRAPWCPACEADALQAADALEKAAPTRCDGYLVHARVLVEQGRRAEGLSYLRAATDRVDEPARCLEQLARLAVAAGDDQEASRAIERLADRPCVPEDECAENLMTAAGLEGLRHSPNRALVYLRRATAAAPRRDDALEAQGSAANALGFHAEALESYRKLVARHPDNAAYQAAAKANASAVGLPPP